MADVLAKSSNIGAIHIGMVVGAANLYEYIKPVRGRPHEPVLSCRPKRQDAKTAEAMAAHFVGVCRLWSRNQRDVGATGANR